MKITRIKINNILGIKELEFEAGKFNEVTGRNGLGKTSIVEALKSIFKPGNDVTLIRNGESKGEIGIELSDGTKIEKSFSSKATLDITDAYGTKIKSPASYLDKMADLVSTNPILFLTADKKSRTNILLEALPLKLSKEELSEIDNIYYENVNTQLMHALEAITIIHKNIYDDRTGVNRVLKDKTSVVNELQEGLNNANFDPSNDFTNKINELEDIKSKMELKIRAIVDELNNKKIDELKRVQDNYLSVANSIEAEYQAELSRIQAERNNKLETAKENLEKSKTEITKENENIIAEKQSAFNVKYQPLLSQITEYKERQKLYAGYEKQNALLNQFVIEKQEMAAKSESLTEQLNILENIKSQMLAKLPIDGLEIIDGQIYRHGVIFDRLNTAQQMDIAIEVAKLRAGEIGVVCVDGLERFDNDTYELFKNKMMESNLQLFVTKVDNGELEINGKMFQLN